MRRAAARLGVTNADVPHSTGASAEPLSLRPARMATESGLRSVMDPYSLGFDDGEELGDGVAHLVHVDQEGVVAVGRVDLGVGGGGAGGVDQLGQAALLV